MSNCRVGASLMKQTKLLASRHMALKPGHLTLNDSNLGLPNVPYVSDITS